MSDNLVWNFEKNDQFMMRSAYNIALQLRREAECSDSSQSWEFIWKSKAPPKVKLFGWRCTQEALPTIQQLRHRGIQVGEGCGYCDSEAEDLMHVLFRCSFARLVWAVSGLPWREVECASHSMETWFREVHRQLGRWDWDFFLTICWAIWWSCNQRLFEGRRLDGQEVI
ncbi:UNVERIFIED_CONTAM: hypothetical protein Slati_1332500 [Sesamum latifolium]|uniref:Reverse transcriptase zinc-binding domain-containing protein n=1 Tax=Sesamum latifolium TaxID=2727402 RepID=A0AAW2XHI7_9LAMI